MRNLALPRHTLSAARRLSITAEFGDTAPAERPSWRVVNADSERPKFYVYDVIGGWDSDAQEFVQAVHALDAPAVDLHINSPGGFVYDAVAMFEALKASPAEVHVHIDGMAASAASFLAQAGDTVSIARAGRVMIHDAQIIAVGSPAEIRDAADLGDRISDDIAGYYADRAGGGVADWRAAMTATTWYSAAEAVAAKLVDRVAGAAPDKKTSGTNLAPRMLRARAAVALEGVSK